MLDVRPGGRRLTGSCDLSHTSIKMTIPGGLVRLEHGTIHGAEARGAPLGPEWSLWSILKSSTWSGFSAFSRHRKTLEISWNYKSSK